MLILRFEFRRWQPYRVLDALCDHLGSLLEVSFWLLSKVDASLFFLVYYSDDFRRQTLVVWCELLNPETSSSLRGR